MAEYKETETKPRLKIEEFACQLKEAGNCIEQLRLYKQEDLLQPIIQTLS
jgi:hypothetical protein